MKKVIRYLAVLMACAALVFFWYHMHAKRQETRRQIDLTKKTVILQFENIQKLETASATSQKVVAWKQEFKDFFPDASRDNLVQNFLFEDSMEMIIEAKITAGFDLSGFNSEWIHVNKDMSITLTLPRAQVLSAALLPSTKPFIRKRGILSQWDLQMETEIRNQALEQMTNDAVEKWLLLRAEDQAERIFSTLLGTFWVQVQDVVISK